MNTSSGNFPNYDSSNCSSDSNGFTMDAHDSTSLSDAYDVQFVFVSDEEMSCEDSFSPASQLPFWWLNDEAACLHSLVVTTYIPLPVLKKFHVVRKVMA